MWWLCTLSMTAAVAAEPSAPAPAAGELTSVISSIEGRYASVDVVRAKFVQTSRSAIYGDETQSGTLVLKRPGQMRWDFQTDGKQFVTDGSVLWVYTPSEKQVIRFANFGDTGGATATALLQSLHRLSELFDVKVLATDAAKGHTLELLPKGGQPADFKRFVLELDAKLALHRITLTDPFDSVTELQFSEVELGGTAADELFRFVVPAGVQVVDAGS